MANGVHTIDVAAPTTRPAPRTRRSALLRFAKKKPLGVAGALLMGALIATALLADFLATHDPTRTSMHVLVAPGADYWMGTDNLGRDLYSRVVHEDRKSVV